MVRFKVVKGSHLLLGFAIAVLLAVVIFISLNSISTDVAASDSSIREAKVAQTFASAVSNEIQIEIIPDAEATPQPPKKTILIYHTHTHEAYEQVADDPYEAVETWRTEDHAHSVVRIGTELASALTELGYAVTHDVTDHELNKLSQSYVRSLETLKSYSQDFDLYIDLHRDAYSEGMLPCLESGQEYAQMMLLVGRGDKHEPSQRPDYESNLAFAQRITSEMNRRVDGIGRNVTVKTGRYNQHIGTPSILIEFGHNKNTLEQALNSVPIAAEAIDAALSQQ